MNVLTAFPAPFYFFTPKSRMQNILHSLWKVSISEGIGKMV